MTDFTSAAERSRGPLARVIDPAIYPDINQVTGDAWSASLRAADAVLSSRWLAEHDRAVRAEALREAANATSRPRNGAPYEVWAWCSQWLRERADRIETNS